MSPVERNALHNGVLLGERHRVGAMIQHYGAVIKHQSLQPKSVTRDVIVTTLNGQVELLREELAQINARHNEWHAYFKQTVNWQTEGYRS